MARAHTQRASHPSNRPNQLISPSLNALLPGEYSAAFFTCYRMKKTTTLILAIFHFSLAFSQWRQANPYGGQVNDLVFPDRKTGYACGQSTGLGNCSGTSSILRTIDGGETWIRVNTGSTVTLNRLHFLDAFTGWALGASSTVIKTTDGGQSWTTQTTGVGSGLNDLHFPNANTGYVVGPGGFLRKSTNGGGTWSTIASGTTQNLFSVWFVDANTGYMVGNGGTVRKTTNGGSSWNSVYTGTELFRDVWFSDANNGYVLAFNKILRTTNGGSSWTAYDSPSNYVLTRFQFISPNKGFAIGDPNLLLKTEDGGQSWTEVVPSGDFDSWRSVFFFDEQNAYGSKDLGRIYQSSNGGLSWTNVHTGMWAEMQDCAFKSPAEGLFVGSNGNIFRTTNGALTLREMTTGSDKFLSSVQYLTDNLVLAAGDSGTVLRSEDAGLSWTNISTGQDAIITDLHAVDSLWAYATTSNGKVLRTINGGLNWFIQEPFEAQTLSAVYFLNRNYGMVCGNGRIYRTSTAGLLWELAVNGVLQNSNFDDIWITSQNVAYASGGFGKLHRTLNGGTEWSAIFPPGQSNAEIDEMFWLTDSLGFFARLNSQARTVNAGVNIGSESTYCLANNGGVNTIFMVGSNYGYCTGGLSRVLHTLKPQELTRTYLQDSIYCSGQRIFVGFIAGGLLVNDNVVTAQLSDASGSFANPVNIGSLTLGLPSPNPSGIITCQLPANASGLNYRIRVVCNDPQLVAPDNGYPIRISNTVQPLGIIEATPANVCSGAPIQFQASGSALGNNPTYLWSLNGVPLNYEAPQLSIDTFTVAGTMQLTVQSSLSCASPLSHVSSLSFNITEAPEFSLGDDQSLCAGESLEIGLNTELTPNWSNNGLPDESLITVSPTQTTNYILALTNSDGCTTSDTLQVVVEDSVSFNISGEFSGCPGDTLSFSVPENQGSYEWRLDDLSVEPENNSYTLVVQSNAALVVQLSTPANCLSADTALITVFELPALPVITFDGGELVVEGGSAFPVQWLLDGNPIPNETNDTLTVSAIGVYTAIVSNAEGCTSTSAPLDLGTVSIAESENMSPLVFIQGGNWVLQGWPLDRHQSTAIRVFDGLGRLIHQTQAQPSGEKQLRMEGIALPAGIYFVQAGNFKALPIVIQP